MAKEEESKPLTVKELASMGGKARAKSMTKAQRSEGARKAVKARWAKAKKAGKAKRKKNERAKE
jgi:ubiquitin